MTRPRDERTHSRSAKPGNCTLPPMQTMLLQNMPCTSCGKAPMASATVSASPAWLRSAGEVAPASGSRSRGRREGEERGRTDRRRVEEDLGDREALVAQV